LASSELFQTLRKYVRGQADKYDIERADPMVYRVVENSVKGLTEIQFEFQRDDDLLKRLGVSHDDIYFVNNIFSPNQNWGFLDESQVINDFLEGYNIFNVLSDENLDTLIYILKNVDPAFNYEELGSEEPTNKRAAEIMMKVFTRETTNIVGDYSSEIERSAAEKAKSVIDEELSEVLEKNEFKVVRSWDTISTTVGQLIMLYVKNGKIWLNFKDLFESIFDDEDHGWNWSEESYEWAYNSNFDKESFNREASWQIDKMKDRVEEDDRIIEFVQLYDRITKKFKVGVVYELPNLKGATFRIKDFDKDDMKIEVILRKGLKSISRKVSEENFYKLLYQPELFGSPFGDV